MRSAAITPKPAYLSVDKSRFRFWQSLQMPWWDSGIPILTGPMNCSPQSSQVNSRISMALPANGGGSDKDHKEGRNACTDQEHLL